MSDVKYSWSYSGLDLFKQCPHKYYRLRIKKDIKEAPSEHLTYGLDMHKAAEDFIKSGTPLPERFAYIQKMMDTINQSKGTKLCEYKMGLTKNLEPCDFFDKDVWWRGIADLIVLQGDKARIIDYKTGKSSRYADTKQLEILSLALFKHFPEVKRVKGGLLFVVANDFVRDEFHVEQEGVYWQRWIADTSRLEESYKTGVWNPRPNFTCSKWCPIADCVHNGNGEYR